MPVHVKVVGERGIIALVLRVELGIIERIIDWVCIVRTLIPQYLLQVTIGIVRSEVWFQSDIIGERAVWRIFRGIAVIVQLITEHHILIGVRQGGIDVEGVTRRLFHNTSDIVVAQSHDVTYLGVTTFQGDRVLLTDASAQRLGEPVSIHTRLNGIIHRLIEFVGCLRTFHCLPAIILMVSFLPVKLFLGIHHIVASEVWSLDVEVTIIGDTHLTTLRANGLNDNDTITCLATIDGLGCGILQDSDTLDAVHIQIINLLDGCLEAIKDEERLILVTFIIALDIEGSLATHLYVWHIVWVGTHIEIVGYLKGRVEVLQTREQVLVAHIQEFILGESSGRTRKAFLSAFKHTCHNNIIQLGIVTQRYIDVTLARSVESTSGSLHTYV